MRKEWLPQEGEGEFPEQERDLVPAGSVTGFIYDDRGWGGFHTQLPCSGGRGWGLGQPSSLGIRFLSAVRGEVISASTCL